MSKTVSIAEARHDLAALVHEAEAGGVVTITRRGQPAAALVPLQMLAALPKPDPWTAYLAWRDRHAAELAEEDPEFDPFADVRDRSPGREPPDFSDD